MGQKTWSVTIGSEPPGRLDKALARDVPEEAHLSRSRLARLLADGAVTRAGLPVTDGKGAVAEGDVYEIVVPEAGEPETRAEAIDLDIVYEDAHLAVVNKPAGLVVHPAPGSPEGTLVNALLHHFAGRLSGVGGEKRPGIVHRIDKDTSGLLVVAKSDEAHHGLAAQFEAHSVDRLYRAICYGVPELSDPRLAGLKGVGFEPGGVIRITSELARHRTDRQRQAVVWSKGRRAVTRVNVIDRFGTGAACVECRLETGRTHQIRVHMSYIGHGLVGDAVYGGRRRLPKSMGEWAAEAARGFSRQALHAARLGFEHPATGERLVFETDWPPDMSALATALRNSA